MSKAISGNTLWVVLSTMLAVATGLAIRPAHADFSTKTHQAPPTVTIAASVDDKGNATITWSDGLQVKGVQHYIGHGRKSGFVKDIQVGAAKQVVLTDMTKNGGRLNAIATDGLFVHHECGGNSETVEPTLKGMVKDCSYKDPKTGHFVGALEVINPKTGKTFTEELK